MIIACENVGDRGDTSRYVEHTCDDGGSTKSIRSVHAMRNGRGAGIPCTSPRRLRGSWPNP
eukprot:788983-Pleurochrysis_carterae.AAC.1